MTTTTATFGSGPNCSFSIGNVTTANGSITGLIPGTVYEIFFKCLNCCKKAATSKSVDSYSLSICIIACDSWLNKPTSIQMASLSLTETELVQNRVTAKPTTRGPLVFYAIPFYFLLPIMLATSSRSSTVHKAPAVWHARVTLYIQVFLFFSGIWFK